MMADQEERKPLVKTLTLGTGQLSGFDSRKNELIPLTDEQRKAVYDALREAAKAFAAMCNITAARHYASLLLGVPKDQAESFSTNYKPILDRLGNTRILSGSVLSQAYVEAKAVFAGEHGKELLAIGSRQLPTFRTDGTHPIPLRAKQTRLHQDEHGLFHLAGNVFDLTWAKEQGLPNWIALALRVKPRDKTMRSQLERIHTGEWTLKTGRILRNPRRQGPRWLAQVMVQYTPDPFVELRKDAVMGIDLGVTTPAALHVRVAGVPQKWAVLAGDGRAMLASRSVIRTQIVRLLRGLRSRTTLLHGPARQAALDKLRDLRKQEQRVMKTGARKIAARIADYARRNGAGVWQMEALGDDIKGESPWLRRNWAPGMLLDAVRWQAAQLGAEIRMVDPAYTSQRCSECGHIDRANRPKGARKASFFLCVKCGRDDHADKNAARNLSDENISRLIAEARAELKLD